MRPGARWATSRHHPDSVPEYPAYAALWVGKMVGRRAKWEQKSRFYWHSLSAMADRARFELTTSAFGGQRSIQLSETHLMIDMYLLYARLIA